MQTPLFFIVCAIATFTAIEANPWYRRNPTKRYGEVVESENKGATNFDVEEFEVKGGDTERKSGGSLTRGDQNPDENQDEGENVDDQGINRHQSGQGFRTSRRNQGGYGRQSGRNKDRESVGDWGNQGGQEYPGSRGIQGGRGNQNSDDRYNDETSDEEDSNLDRAALRWRQEILRRSFDYYGRYQYGNSYKYLSDRKFQRYPGNWDGDIDDNRKKIDEEDKNLYEYQQSDKTQGVSRGGNRRWQPKDLGARGARSEYPNGNIFQHGRGNQDINGYQYGNQNHDDNGVQSSVKENYDGEQNQDGDQNENPTTKTARGSYFNGDEVQSSNKGQADNMSPTSNEDVSGGQAGISGQDGNWRQRNSDGENRHKNQGRNRGSDRRSGKKNMYSDILNIGNGVGNTNTVHLPL